MLTDDPKRIEKIRKNAAWSPQPKQELALCRTEFEVGFGGSRGGGKTDAGIAWTGYDSHEPRLHGLIIRKNSTDLGDWLLRAKEIHRGLKIVGNPPILKFPGPHGEEAGGATYFTGHLKDKSSFSKYVGQNLPRMLLEELNLIPSEEQYEKVLASCRSTIPGIKPQVFSTFNPDNVGHSWIKRRFRLSGIPKNPILTKDDRTDRMRIFVPATVDDNPALTSNDPDYVKFLNGLPDGLREQWRWGSWDDPIIRGAYYTLELAQARKDGRIGDVPYHPEYPVHLYWDIGNDMTVILFVQFVDGFINIIDFYQNDSIGFPHYLTKLQEYREMRNYSYGIYKMPHDFDRVEWGSGRARKEVLEQRQIDFDIVPRPKVKQDAIDQTRILFPRLRMDKNKCEFLIDALVNYRKEWLEDLQTYGDKPVHDWSSHPADALSYIAIDNHDSIAPKKKSQELKSDVDELQGAGPRRSVSAEFRNDEVPVHNRFHHD